MRVYELAKKLGISSKDICQFLSTASKEYKTMSGLSDEEQENVTSHFKNQSNTSKQSISGERKEKKHDMDNKNNSSSNESNRVNDKNESPKGNHGKSFSKTSNDSKEGKEKDSGENKEKKHKISRLYFPQNSEKKRSENRKQQRQQPSRPVFARTPNQHKRPTQSERLEQAAKEAAAAESKNKKTEISSEITQTKIHETLPSSGADKKEFVQTPPAESKDQGRRQDNRKNHQKKNHEYRKDEERENLDFSGQKHNKHDKKKDKQKEKQKEKAKDKQKDIVSKKTDAPIEAPAKQEEEVKTLILPDYLTVKELADKMKLAPAQIVKDLFLKGQVVTINQEIDFEMAENIALEYEFLCEKEEKIDVIAELLKEDEDAPEAMSERPPVVAVMGHVDHGKTSLLDAIKETNVTDKEAGGITQKIGAYQVKTANGRLITFLDTPGHEAFTAMRMRGAQSTDIAILVVAADDGVMPQTIEAINHAKDAGLEIIVAVNKIDKPTANVEKVKQELMQHELIPEEWGGTTVFCPVSAHTGEGIEDLLEMVLLTSDVLELKANKNRNARGIVIEAEVDKGQGVVVSVLVQKGTLHVGDAVAAGESFGKVRAMINDKQRRIKEAGPSTPVEILGMNAVPNAGEIFMAFENEKESRNFASTFVTENRLKMVEDTRHRMSLDDLFEQIKAGTLRELKLIVKADVQGSVEALTTELTKLSNDEVVVRIIHKGVGNISESDVMLASASDAIILGYNVKPDPRAKDSADREGVDIRMYDVIYHASEAVKDAIRGMAEPKYVESIIGHAEIKQIFKASGVGNIAGSIVTDGKITAQAMVKITRGDECIYEGKIASLKHYKDEVREVKSGTECGLVFEDFDSIAEGDIVEASEMIEVENTEND